MDQIHGRKPLENQTKPNQNNPNQNTQKTTEKIEMSQPLREDFCRRINTAEIPHILLCCLLLETGTGQLCPDLQIFLQLYGLC